MQGASSNFTHLVETKHTVVLNIGAGQVNESSRSVRYTDGRVKSCALLMLHAPTVKREKKGRNKNCTMGRW